jgi:hypothetical protein
VYGKGLNEIDGGLLNDLVHIAVVLFFLPGDSLGVPLRLPGEVRVRFTIVDSDDLLAASCWATL